MYFVSRFERCNGTNLYMSNVRGSYLVLMEVDVQILGGVAVTVLLALLFFATVVLWDISLALRGVGDKIDKLEDTLDDDITDLTHTVDGTAGGGTQLHLNGGGTTIGSGPGAGQVATAAGPHSAAVTDDGTTPNPDTQPAAAPEGTTRPEEPNGDVSEPTPDADDTAAQAPSDAAMAGVKPETEADSESHPSRASLGADPTPVRGPNAPGRSTDTESATEADVTAAPETENPNHDRFVTSPDRTPWHARPLDRETVAANRSVIAGALEAGSVDPESPGDPSSVPDEEPIVLGGTTTAVDDGDTADNETHIDDSTPSSGTAGSGGDGSPDETDDSDVTPAAIDEGTGGAATPDEDELSDSSLDRGSLSSDVDDDAASIFDVVTGDDLAAVAQSTDQADPTDDRTAAELFEALLEDLGLLELRTRLDAERQSGVERTDTADASVSEDSAETDPDESRVWTGQGAESDPSDGEQPVADTDDEAAIAEDASTDESETESNDSDDGDDANGGDDVEDARSVDSQPGEESHATDSEEDGNGAADEADGGDETDEALLDGPDSGVEYTFEEFSPKDTGSAELSVDDAVDQINDESPSLSRSTRRLTSKATADDDGVTLSYELDAEAADSTTRLLRYQLQQFADQAGGDVDVSVSGNRVVVEIPDAEGSAVSQWRRAIVEVVDRTYYLSDNSEE